MKNTKKALFFAALAATLAMSAFAQSFEKNKTYSDGLFSDVPTSEWYAGEVRSTYELGLMNGIGDGLFDPNGSVTVAEAVTMAARAHAIYTGATIPEAEGEWYQMYVSYATANSFVSEGQFDSFDRPAKRHEVAQLFENAMPDGYYTQKNTVSEIPDVSESRAYADELLTLYRAGVVMGSDSYGNFHPTDNITRAEAAAILNRVALPENRLQKTLDVYSPDGAYLLVYNDSFDSWGGKEGINSGWTLDNRGGSPRTSISDSYGSLADVSREYGTAMIREFNNTTTGLVQMEATFSISENSDGIYMDFRNKDGNPVYRLEAQNDTWTYLMADGTTKDIYPFDEGETAFTFKLLIDLDNARSTTLINGKDCGTLPLATAGKAKDTNLQTYRYGTTEESLGVIRGTSMFMAVNYAVYDGGCTVEPGKSKYESFRPVSGTAVAESAILLKNGQGGSFTFASGAAPVATFTADDKNFYVNGQMVYENYVRTVMYTFRLEMDTEAQSICVRVNGRIVATVPFASEATAIDNYTIASPSETDSFSPYYMRIFEKKLAEDYVPEPVRPAGEDKYNVGINICSLWRNGMHSGWACITPYDDIRPVLGYYDEGNPETADWEIKYMVEHGIDYQAFCWFPGRNTVPIDVFSNDYHLKDGYMNAEYSYMMKYCLIYEASSGAKPQNMQQWKDHFVPCLIEHYFKDERYMTIDNRLLFYVFTPDKLYGQDGLGSVELCREALDYLEEEVKKLGFDGMIYIGSNAASSEKLAAAGFDATSAYNWGTNGYQLETNKNANLSNAKDTNVYTIPTLSVGFNSVGWSGVRTPLMTKEDMKATATWLRDEFAPKYAKKDSWQENLFMISTWNEYGEGTYIMPCESLNGFGYLDALRSVFTEEAPNASLNTIPTANQLSRINRMYPQHKRLLRKNGDYVKPETEIDLSTYENVLTVKPGTHPGAINPAGIENFAKHEDGSISGKTNSPDNYLAFGNGNNLDLSTATLVKIRAKLPVGKAMRMYFTTVEDQSWNESKAFTATASETADFAEYYYDFSANKNWTGTLLWYRLDPSGSAGDEFVIESIEFLGTESAPPEEKLTLTINGNAVDMKLPPQKSATGDYLIAFDPSIGLEFLFNTYCEWDKATSTLTINGCGHTVKYIVGKDFYYVDGKDKKLGYKLEAFDGLPMIPLQKFCEDMGYTFEMTENGPSVITTEATVKADFYAAKQSRTPYSWEFNVNGDNEGWNTSHMTLLTSDGYMSCQSNSNFGDPALYLSIAPFEAEKYTKIAFRVRYDYTPSMVEVKDEDGNPTGEMREREEALTMYFATSSEPSLSESKTLKLTLKGHSSNGEWEEYEAEISNKSWKDKITSLRFDPFNAPGKIDVDYIRILEDPDYETKKNAPKPFEIVNPDAEGDKIGFISHNAAVSIVMDPIDGSDNCYAFLPKNDSKVWTYAMHDVYFTNGATYLIEYDIAFASLGTDTNVPADEKEGSSLCNFQFEGADHVVEGSSASFVSQGDWHHVSTKYTVSLKEGETTKGRFSIFSNPLDEKGVGFYLDNVKVTEILPKN